MQTPNNIEIYLKHIEDICGGEGEFFNISENDHLPVTIVSYADIPQQGSTTSFSFGLSSIVHPEWVNSRPELVLSVDSADTAWPLAMGELIRNGRERDLFSYGTILHFGQPVSDESPMSSFLVFACTVLDESDISVELNDRKVHLSQIYPIHESEASIIREVGPEKFIQDLGAEVFNVKRAARVGSN